MRSLILPSLALAVILAACTSGGGTPSTAPATSSPVTGGPSDLDGRTFVSTGVQGHALAPGSQVRLAFGGVHLGASAGCNQMSGEYEVTGGVLKVGTMATTEMACEAPLMAQDQWLTGFLPGAAVTLDGDTLTLAKDGVTLTLLDDAVANPDQPLEGTRWVVDGIISGDAVSSVPGGATAAIELTGGRAHVEAGCNTGGGSYSIAGATITFGPVATTRMACPEDAMALEAAVLGVLDGSAEWSIDGPTLTLRNGAGGLILKAAS